MHQLQGNKEYGSEKKGYLLKKSDGYVHRVRDGESELSLCLCTDFCCCLL